MSATQNAKPPAIDETRLILNALRYNQQAAIWEAERAQVAANWDNLAIRAIVFGLAPQLHARLVEWGLDVPSRAAAKLSVTYQAHATRNAAIFAQLGEFVAACAEHNLHPIALKGVHLAATVYAEPACRPMNDIDLLFAASEIETAAAILTQLGYLGKHTSSEFGPGVTKHTSTYRRATSQAATPNPYLSSNAERMIEPHISLEESWFGLQVDVTPGVRERAASADLGGHSCRVLAAEDLLLHLCVHFCFHLIMGAPAMVQLTDLLAVTTGASPDWTVFAERAVAQRAAPFALAALKLAHDLLAAPVPDATFRALAAAIPASSHRYVTRLGLADILRRTQQSPLITIAQRIRRGFSDRAEAARWAGGWRGRWQVWQTALRVGRTDTAQLLLKSKAKP